MKFLVDECVGSGVVRSNYPYRTGALRYPKELCEKYSGMILISALLPQE